MVHDTSRGSEHDVSELTGWQQLDNPLLEFGQADVVTWGDNSSLIETITASQYHLRIDNYKYPYRPFSWITILPER